MAGKFDRTESWFDSEWYDNPLKSKPVDPNDPWYARGAGKTRNFFMRIPNTLSKVVPIGLDWGGNLLRGSYKPVTVGIDMIGNQVESMFKAVSKILLDHPIRAIHEVMTSTTQSVFNIIKSPVFHIGRGMSGK
jgi:hypothetical protein